MTENTTEVQTAGTPEVATVPTIETFAKAHILIPIEEFEKRVVAWLRKHLGSEPHSKVTDMREDLFSSFAEVAHTVAVNPEALVAPAVKPIETIPQ